MTKHMIFAGNYAQARNFATEKGWRRHEWSYVHSAEILRGIEGRERNPASQYEFHSTGTAADRDDYRKVLEIAAISGLVKVAQPSQN